MEDGAMTRWDTDLPLLESDFVDAGGPREWFTGSAEELGGFEDPDVSELREAIRAISAATAQALHAVSRCAEKRTFAERGFRSMTDWLSTEFPVGMGTAKEWAFVSKKLTELPAVAGALAEGSLTPQQLMPLARFATPDDETHWVKAAPRMYPAQLWRERARRTRPRLKDERAAHASRYFRLVWDREDPVLYLEGRLGKEQGSALEEAIRERSRDVPVDEGADDASEARRADALVELATSAGGMNARNAHVVVYTSVEVLNRSARRGRLALCETESGRRLHPETARRIACDADVEWMFEDEGRPFGIGRKSARVPSWLERAVRHRDGGACRFPGCERRISMLSHHIKHWADGGGTDIANLVTLCSTHHHYVHEDGWRISGDPHGNLRFHDPTGRTRASPSGRAA